MPTVVCKVLKDIEVGVIEKKLCTTSKGNKYITDRTSKVIPIGIIKAGEKVQLRHGWNGGDEQRVYLCSDKLNGWFITKNKEGYSLNEVFKPVRKNRSPWEALY